MAKKKRPNSEGMVRKRPDGRWEGRIVIGYKNNSTPIYKTLYAKTQKELLPKLHTAIESYRDVRLTEDSRMTLAQWLDTWMSNYLPSRVRLTTIDGYETNIRNYVTPYLGDKPVYLITRIDLQRLYTKLLEEGRVNEDPQLGRTLSPTTVNKVHNMLHCAFEDAINANIIAINPASGASVPRPRPATMKVLDDEQLDRFMVAISEDAEWYDFFYTAITTGLRRGEICGLMWEDFDEAHGKLAVRRTLVRRKRENILNDTKTNAGRRVILLPASTTQLLKTRKKHAISQWIFPRFLHPEDPICPSTAYQKLKSILAENNLPSIRFHDLRHTFATHAVSSGVDAKTLSSILGHTNASFTLDRYTHFTGDMQKQAAVIVGNFVDQIMGGEVSKWLDAEKTAKGR